MIGNSGRGARGGDSYRIVIECVERHGWEQAPKIGRAIVALIIDLVQIVVDSSRLSAECRETAVSQGTDLTSGSLVCHFTQGLRRDGRRAVTLLHWRATEIKLPGGGWSSAGSRVFVMMNLEAYQLPTIFVLGLVAILGACEIGRLFGVRATDGCFHPISE
jgi:hypothetical protein